MSDMASERITVRVPQSLSKSLRKRSESSGNSESKIVREALEDYFARHASGGTAHERLAEAGLIGVVKDAPPGLSTSRRHFDGFGESK